LLWSLLLSSMLSVAGYWTVIDAYFVSDDFPNVAMNMAPGAAMSQFMSSATGLSPNKSYRPLIAVLWMADFQVWGANARAYHIHNLVWHVATCVLLALLVHFFTGSGLAAIIASSIMAIHPLHPEAVTWISARGDLMVAAFTLLCVSLLARRFVRRRGFLLLLGSALLFLLTLLSKESGLGTPLYLALFLVVYGRFWKRQERLRKVVVTALPYVAVLAGYLVVRRLALHSVFLSAYPDMRPEYHAAWVLNAFSRLIAPLNWGVFPQPWAVVVAVVSALLYLTPVGIFLGQALRQRRRNPRHERAMLFFGLSVLASLVPVYQIFQSMNDLQGARHWYAATMWFSGLLGAVAAQAWARAAHFWRIVLATSLALLATVNLYVLIENNSCWSQAGALTRDLVSRLPDTPGEELPLEVPPYELDSVSGAYVFRNGLDVAIRRPFARRDHTMLGWLPGSQPGDPPVPIGGAADAGVLVRVVNGERQPMIRLVFRCNGN